MKLLYTLLLLFLSFSAYSQQKWQDVAVLEDREIYIDPQSIVSKENSRYALSKTVYLTEASRAAYVKKIHSRLPRNADKKIKKWDNFSYTISYCLYDCSNKRFKVLEIADYDSNDKLIVKTKTKETKQYWQSVEIDTVGDHVIFFACDYGAE